MMDDSLIAASPARFCKWNIRRSEAIVAKFMQGFTDPTTKASGLIAALPGAGKELFDASPAVFQEAFWELMTGGKPPATIAIVSEEPFIPWELMVPNGLHGWPLDFQGQGGSPVHDDLR